MRRAALDQARSPVASPRPYHRPPWRLHAWWRDPWHPPRRSCPRRHVQRGASSRRACSSPDRRTKAICLSLIPAKDTSDIKRLYDIVQDQTTVTANELVRPYIGKPIEVSGHVKNVNEISTNILVTIEDQDGVFITLIFDLGEIDSYLKSLQNGMTLTASGNLKSVDKGLGVSIEKCTVAGLNPGRGDAAIQDEAMPRMPLRKIPVTLRRQRN